MVVLTRGARAPENHFGLVDHETVAVFGYKTRGAIMAIRIEDALAAAADDMVVVVPRARLIKRDMPLGLDLAHDPAFDQRIKVVIDRLFRRGGDLAVDDLENRRRIGMGIRVQRLKQRQPHGGQAQVMLSEKLFVLNKHREEP